MGVLIGLVVAFALLLAYVRTVQWVKETHRTRFAFEDREAYLLLKLDGALGGADSAVVTMRALREALLLKVAEIRYRRVLVEVTELRIANARAFGFLIGALGPVLMNEDIHLAIVCSRRTLAARLFRETGILNAFPSLREAERHLQSAEPRQRVPLDVEQVNALLVPGRKAA